MTQEQFDKEVAILTNTLKLYFDLMTDPKTNSDSMDILEEALKLKKTELEDLKRNEDVYVVKDSKDAYKPYVSKSVEKEIKTQEEKAKNTEVAVKNYLDNIKEPILNNRFVVEIDDIFGFGTEDVESISYAFPEKKTSYTTFENDTKRIQLIVRDNVTAPILKLQKLYNVDTNKNIVVRVLNPDMTESYHIRFFNVKLVSFYDDGFNYKSDAPHTYHLSFTYQTYVYGSTNKE